jgi:hypothetical protein
MQYKYNKAAGALNEAIQQQAPSRPPPPARALPSSRSPSQTLLMNAASPLPPDAFDSDVEGHNTGVFNLPAGPPPVHTQAASPAHGRRALATRHARPPHLAAEGGVDPHSLQGGRAGMFFYTVDDGQRVLMISRDGTTQVVQGPRRLWRIGRRFKPMLHYVAHPGEFLIVRVRDGAQQHLAGPCDLWMDPRQHLSIEKEEALPLADKEAVVVYSRDDQGRASRRLVHGPATFIPAPGEWLHTFSWHGATGASGVKVPNALTFQKLWLLPDQMYHNIDDVRTADDAVLTVRLMIFFELVNIDRMLEATHDPIGDFINAASSDVIDFTARYAFHAFKQHTHLLNELETYRQLTSRAEQSGYRINKVVYRGYSAPPALQHMQDQAIESRTRLQLEKDTERQAQDLADAKLERELARAEMHRQEQTRTLQHNIAHDDAQQAAFIERTRARLAFDRQQTEARATLTRDLASLDDARQQAHLARLKDLGVDLTRFLTQHRADRVIEVRSPAQGQHLHLHTPPDDDPSPKLP